MPWAMITLRRGFIVGTLSVLSMTQVLVSGSPRARALGADPVARAKLWEARYNGPGNSSDGAAALGVSRDGAAVFVTGYSYGSTTSYDYATVAYDRSTGAELWEARYNGPGNGNDFATALKVSPDGTTVFVTGYSWSGTAYDFATVAYDASNGTRRWRARYNGPSNNDDVAYALGVSPDGTAVFVTGYSSSSSTGYDYATVTYDAATGRRRWQAGYNGPGNADDAAYALGVSPDGTAVFVTGYSSSGTDYDYATVAHNASTGARQWVRRYKGPGNGNDGPFALGVSPDGAAVFVTGYSSSGTDSDYATVAYDAATGAKRWASRYNGPGNGDDVATALNVGPDGATVFVTGYSSGSGTSFDVATVAYDATTGRRQWEARYNGPGNGDDGGYAVGTTPNGATVFVTGYSSVSHASFAFTSLIYDTTTGTERGSTRLGAGSGNALGVSPDGTVLFVTGSVGRVVGDYGTVAYSLTR